MRLALFATLNRPHALEIVRQTVKWLLAHGHEVRLAPALGEVALNGSCCVVPEAEVVQGAELVLAIGGDGTILGATRAAAPYNVPILGVNAGALGFLTELTPDELPTALPRVVSGDYQLEARMMLRAQLLRGIETVESCLALNDIVVRQGPKGRLIRLDVRIAGHQLGHFAADGLIVSSPTGSTAYGLAAGGPIVHPTTSVLLLVPVCPHSLSFRPMVVPATDPIDILCEGNQHGDDMQVSADGQEPLVARAGDHIIVSPAPEHALFVKLGTFSFYDRLREKLQWGGRA